MSPIFYAHSVEGKPVDEWHVLEKHLKGTSELAKSFAAEFGCGEWAYLAGLWHNIGKYSEDFQKMILASADQGDSSLPARERGLKQQLSVRSIQPSGWMRIETFQICLC